MKNELATLILKAADLREASWDEHAYNLAKPLERKYRDFYGVSLQAACEVACREEPAMAHVVHALLLSHWNGSIQWAKENKE